MTVNLVALYPGHLNLNGDQSNLTVAKQRLEWFGYKCEILSVEKGDQIPAHADLIFIGHGSYAAWSDLEEEFRKIKIDISSLVARGCGLMAIASGYEKAIELGFFAGDLSSSRRTSKFEIAKLDGLEVLGYQNTITKAPIIQKKGLLLGSQLHGPIFAKNPELADSYLAEIMSAKNEAIPVGVQSNQLKIDQITKLVDSVWELERELTRE